LGIEFGISWFLILTRNAAYVSFHRKQALRESIELWKPKTCTPPSNNFERTFAALFTIYWLVMLNRFRPVTRIVYDHE
jgi:hypothetical protein